MFDKKVCYIDIVSIEVYDFREDYTLWFETRKYFVEKLR